MNKIIINNKSKINDEKALNLVLSVIKMGRISQNNKSYCACTSFKNNIVILAQKRKNDIFTIFDNISQ